MPTATDNQPITTGNGVIVPAGAHTNQVCWRCGGPTARPEYTLCYPCDYRMALDKAVTRGDEAEADRIRWFARNGGVSIAAAACVPSPIYDPDGDVVSSVPLCGTGQQPAGGYASTVAGITCPDCISHLARWPDDLPPGSAFNP